MSDRATRRFTVRRAIRGATKVLPSPSQAVGVETIRGGVTLIQGLVDQLRAARANPSAGPAATPDFITEARLSGMSVSEVDRRIAAMRAQTVRSALVAGSLAALVFVVWAWSMLHAARGDARWLSTLEYLPFFSAALLYAFRASWLNWQLRIRRRGSPLDYLGTDRGFWPN